MQQFLSSYLYCANNPVNFIDPWGTYAITDSVADGKGGWTYFTTWTELQGITVNAYPYPGWSPDYSSFLNNFNHNYWSQNGIYEGPLLSDGEEEVIKMKLNHQNCHILVFSLYALIQIHIKINLDTVISEQTEVKENVNMQE